MTRRFTLTAKNAYMYLLCILFTALPQQAAAQDDAMEAKYTGIGLVPDTLTCGTGPSSVGATRVMLYNLGKDMFLNSAGYWGTRTATFTVGLPLVFQRMEEGKNIFNIHGPFGENKLVAFVPDHTGNDTKYGVFFDRSESNNGNWEFEKVTEGEYADKNVYRIKVYATDTYTNSNNETITITDYFYLCAKQPMIVNVFQKGNDNLVKALTLNQISDSIQQGKMTAEHTYWRVVSDAQMVAQFENTYTEDGPADASFLLRAQGFNRENMYNNKNYGRGWEKDGNFTYRIGFAGLNIGGHTVEAYQVDPIFGMFYCAGITGGNTGERLYQTVKITRSGWYKIECQGLFNDKDGTTEPYAKLYAKFTDAKTENSPEWASCYLLPKSYGEVESRLNSIGYNTETFKSFQDDYGDQHPTYTFLADDINDGKISNKIEAAVAFYKLIYPNSVMIYVNLDEAKNESKIMELGIQLTKNMAADEYVYIDDFRLKYLGASFVLNDDWTDFKRGSNADVPDYTQKYQNNVLILKRELAKDKWNSICLPVNLTAQQLRETFSSSVKLAKLSDPISDTQNCIEFRLVNLNTAQEKDIVLRAGECYIIKPGEGNYIQNGEIKIGDEANEAVKAPYYVIPRVSLTKNTFAENMLNITDEKFKGFEALSYNADETHVQGRTYSVNGTECQLKVYATFENDTPTPAGAYNFYEGDLYHFKSDRNRLKGYNWWIEDIHAGETAPAAHTLSFRASMDGISDNTTTAIEGIAMDMDCHAVTPQTAVYNVCGQAVRRGTTSIAGLPAGLYVVNGKKVLVR